MSKRCELQKEYYKERGNYKGDGKYTDDYVAWLEEKIVKNNVDLADVIKCYSKKDLDDAYQNGLAEGFACMPKSI